MRYLIRVKEALLYRESRLIELQVAGAFIGLTVRLLELAGMDRV
jgi:hypothetical protein